MSTPTSNQLSPEKQAVTETEIHPLLRERWSPRAFDPNRSVSAGDLQALLQAARWAPSSMNEQPWRFIVARKEDASRFAKVLSTLVETNQTWARNASVLLIAVAKQHFGGGPNANRWAIHDVGLAMGNLVVQATALGLHVHMMGGFHPAKAREEFGIPEGYEPITAAAVGYVGDPAMLPDDLRLRELAPRKRKSINEIAFGDAWDSPLLLEGD